MFFCLSPLLTLAVKVIHNLTLTYFSILMFLCFNVCCFMYMQFPFSMFLLMLFLSNYDVFITKLPWNKPFKSHRQSYFAHETFFQVCIFLSPNQVQCLSVALSWYIFVTYLIYVFYQLLRPLRAGLVTYTFLQSSQ